jgi:hypothetical protein
MQQRTGYVVSEALHGDIILVLNDEIPAEYEDVLNRNYAIHHTLPFAISAFFNAAAPNGSLPRQLSCTFRSGVLRGQWTHIRCCARINKTDLHVFPPPVGGSLLHLVKDINLEK